MARPSKVLGRRGAVSSSSGRGVRHTVDRRMAAAGPPVRMIQKWMGHRDNMTTKLYADYAPDPTQGAAWAQSAFREDRPSLSA
jgi:integrase